MKINSVFFLFIIFSCSFVPNKGSDISSASQTDNAIFKKWLRDTLLNLKNSIESEKNKTDALKNYEVTIAPDSLSLSVTKEFAVSLGPDETITENRQVQNVIALLKEYGEMPAGHSTLRFSSYDYFSPSPVQGIPCEDLFELKNFQVEQPGVLNIYTYVRGRINDKRVVKKVQGKEIIEDYDFIWNENQLKKVKK